VQCGQPIGELQTVACLFEIIAMKRFLIIGLSLLIGPAVLPG